MKTKFMVALLIGAFVMTFPTRVAASPDDSGLAMIGDVIIARPLCLAATAIGSVFFVVSLPFAAATGDIERTAQALVVTPAKATFTRPLGDFEELKDY